METLKTIEFVYFDLGKVLLDFSHDRMCSQMGNVLGVKAEDLKSLIFDANGFGPKYEIGKLDSRQFCDALFEATGRRCDPDELLLAGSDIFTLKEEMVPLVSKLKSSQMPIGILSNTCAAHWEFALSKFEILQQGFKPTILSYEVNALKPNRDIYEIAAASAGVLPENVFFVDDREDNVHGALAAGFDAHVFQSAFQVEHLLRERGFDV